MDDPRLKVIDRFGNKFKPCSSKLYCAFRGKKKAVRMSDFAFRVQIPFFERPFKISPRPVFNLLSFSCQPHKFFSARFSNGSTSGPLKMTPQR